MVNRIKGRLSGWKANYLSKGGRLTLIKVAMANISIYFMSIMIIPKHIALTIQILQRELLWKGGMAAGMHIVNW